MVIVRKNKGSVRFMADDERGITAVLATLRSARFSTRYAVIPGIKVDGYVLFDEATANDDALRVRATEDVISTLRTCQAFA